VSPTITGTGSSKVVNNRTDRTDSCLMTINITNSGSAIVTGISGNGATDVATGGSAPITYTPSSMTAM
jgi:hypothetical protein